jgi:transposase InsO family protein
VFALKNADLGRTDLVEHEIDVGDNRPVRMAPRRIPLHKIDVVEKAIAEMEDKGVIRPSNSPWSAPIVIVQKKDGTARFCVDYRNLNECTKKDAYPIPRIEDNLDALEGAKWFSTLDLASGYWQVAVAEKDREKTAFTTKFGLYEFNVLPFGLCNGPATFQRLMEQVLRGLQWKSLVLYLDDIIVFSQTFEEHLIRLQEVLGRLRNAGLKLKPMKCQFFQGQVSFLGHIIDAQGIHTDPDKVRQIKNWATPENLTEVRIFLGLTSYYRRFVKEYARIASPMYDLTRKDVDFHWSEEQENAFVTLKKELVQSTELAYPIPDIGGFILDTDASGVAIGAVLSQIQGGEEKILAFGSRCLSQAEKNYCVTRRELLAVVYFMCYYKHYLIGTTVRVRTDHGSLRWLQNMRNPTGQVARWKERLAPFTWIIEHRPGKQHQNADALSRKRCEGDCAQCLRMFPQAEPTIKRAIRLLKELGEEVITINLGRKRDTPQIKPFVKKKQAVKEQDEQILKELKGMWDIEGLSIAVAKDPILQVLLSWDTTPEWELIATKSSEFKYYWQQWDSGKFKVRNGLIWYRWDVDQDKIQWKLLIPTSYQEKVLQALHDNPNAGHLGEVRSVHLMKRTPVYWHRCYQDMRMHCRCCEECLRCKPQLKKARAQMKSFTAGEPMERMAIDVLGEIHESSAGNKCILVIMDYFTKYVILVPTKDQKAVTVARAMVDHVFSILGIPKLVHSDRGTDFCSKVFRETCRLFNIDKTYTTPWRPQSDGMVERMNRTLGSMLKVYTNKLQDDWDQYLPLCSMAYNSSRHSSTQYTPNFLMFGREFRIPLEMVLPVPDESLCTAPGHDSLDHFVKRLNETFKIVYSLTREHLQSAMVMQKHYYDRKAKTRKFEVGQSVWLYNPRRKKGRTPKLDKPWDGPFVVVKVLGDVLCAIQMNRRTKPKIVHIDKLVHTRKSYDTDWVFHLPKRRSNIHEDSGLEQISKLFEETPRKEKMPKIPPKDQFIENELVLRDKPEMISIETQTDLVSKVANHDSSVEALHPYLDAKTEENGGKKKTRSGKIY